MPLACACPLLLGVIVAAVPEEADFAVETTALEGLLAETTVARGKKLNSDALAQV